MSDVALFHVVASTDETSEQLGNVAAAPCWKPEPLIVTWPV